MGAGQWYVNFRCQMSLEDDIWTLKNKGNGISGRKKKINANTLKLNLRMHVSRVSGAWWTRGDGVRRLEIIRRSHAGFCFLSLLLKTKSNMPPGNLMWTDDLWESLWCWERLRAEGEEGIRGWDGWMASLMQWTWTWANSRKWWGTGRPGVL